MTDKSDVVGRLRDESARLSGHSLDRGIVDAGIAANLADEAADEIDRLTAALASERERAEKAERALAREREIPGVSMEPHDDAELTARIVRCAYGWQVDPAGRLYGLVAGDMGYTATHIVLGEEDRWGKGDAKWAFEDRKKIEAERDAFAKRVTELEGALNGDDDLMWILSRPNFACSGLAGCFRAAGATIPYKAEDEQAYVIHQMLECYFESREAWRDLFEARIKAASAVLKKENAG